MIKFIIIRTRIVISVLSVVIILLFTANKSAFGDESIQASQRQIIEQVNMEDDQLILIYEYLNRVKEINELAESQDEFQELLKNDSVCQEIMSVLDFEINSDTTDDEQCHLTPLICFWDYENDDFFCKYKCMGLYGVVVLEKKETGFCYQIAVCLMFNNCSFICKDIK